MDFTSSVQEVLVSCGFHDNTYYINIKKKVKQFPHSNFLSNDQHNQTIIFKLTLLQFHNFALQKNFQTTKLSM